MIRRLLSRHSRLAAHHGLGPSSASVVPLRMHASAAMTSTPSSCRSRSQPPDHCYRLSSCGCNNNKYQQQQLRFFAYNPNPSPNKGGGGGGHGGRNDRSRSSDRRSPSPSSSRDNHNNPGHNNNDTNRGSPPPPHRDGRKSHGRDDDRRGNNHRDDRPSQSSSSYKGNKRQVRGPAVDKKPEKPNISDNLGIAVAKKTKGGKSSGVCYGCGAELIGTKRVAANNTTTTSGSGDTASSHKSGSMHVTTKKGGYWNEKKELLKISKLKNWALCDRCKTLNNPITRRSSNPNDDDDALLALAPNSKMTQVFREQVSKIQHLPEAVVVLCLDASNWTGTFVRTIRNYVGGNPILLAVTRCDLLPEYLPPRGMRGTQQQHALKDFYRAYTRSMHPAGVYLCSSSEESASNLYSTQMEDEEYSDDDEDYYDDYDDDKHHRKQRGHDRYHKDPTFLFRGMQELADDLDAHLDDRDPYIVGAANIGKSTLTDHLITDFLNRGMQEHETNYWNRQKYSQRRGSRSSALERLDKLTQKRIQKLQQSRVTKSSLPGTTLQNIRIPCFVYNHEQALWDTPGLLLDESLSHFPIQNLARIRALRPEPIVPVEFSVDPKEHKSFALILYERDDAEQLPLLRIHVRRKKGDQVGDDDEPVRLIWNSTLTKSALATKIVTIDEALQDEKKRQEQIKQASKQRQHQQNHHEEEKDQGGQQQQQQQRSQPAMTKEEKAQRREERRRAYENRIQQEKAELGAAEWHRQEQLRLQQREQERRLQTLANLALVHTHVNDPHVGMDVSIANMGWLGVLPPCTAMFQVYAPSTGVRVDTNPTIGLPSSWGHYKKASFEDKKDKSSKKKDDESDDDHDDHDDYEEDHAWDDMDDGYDEYDEYGDLSLYDQDWDEYRDGVDDGGDSDDGARRNSQRRSNDPWEPFSGKNIGWEFDDKTRFSKSRLVDGWFPIPEEKDKDKDDVA